MESVVRATMIAVDPLQPIFHLQPMTTYIALSLSQRRFALALVAVFGVLGLVLAMGGVYGVVSYVVEQRRREIGLRLALGATPSGIGWVIVRQVLFVTTAGIVSGSIGAAIFTNRLSPLLFGVTRLDPQTTIVAAFALFATAAIASAMPLVRAARVNPMVALRSE